MGSHRVRHDWSNSAGTLFKEAGHHWQRASRPVNLAVRLFSRWCCNWIKKHLSLCLVIVTNSDSLLSWWRLRDVLPLIRYRILHHKPVFVLFQVYAKVTHTCLRMKPGVGRGSLPLRGPWIAVRLWTTWMLPRRDVADNSRDTDSWLDSR